MFSVWANQECTQRPQVGVVYNQLFVKCLAEVPLGVEFIFGNVSNSITYFYINAGVNNYNEPGKAFLWVDYISEDFAPTQIIHVGDVIPVLTGEYTPEPFDSSWVTDFYDYMLKQ